MTNQLVGQTYDIKNFEKNIGVIARHVSNCENAGDPEKTMPLHLVSTELHDMFTTYHTQQEIIKRLIQHVGMLKEGKTESTIEQLEYILNPKR